MAVSVKHSFEDSWLSKALVYYKIIDESLLEELVMRNTEEKYFYDILLKNDYLNENEVKQFVNIALQIPSIDLDKIKPEAEKVELLCNKYTIQKW